MLLPSNPRSIYRILRALENNQAEFYVAIIVRTEPHLIGGLKSIDRNLKYAKVWVLIPLPAKA